MGGIETLAQAIGADLLARLAWQNKKQREGLALLAASRSARSTSPAARHG